jgi:D-alanine-D-alanine ligase
MGKIKVTVIMGGKSPEYEISLISGREVVKNLQANKYLVQPVIISRSGDRWQLVSKDTLYSLPDPLKLKGTKKEIIQENCQEIQGFKTVKEKPDVVFIAMHGRFGEDGTIQGVLEASGIKYTGSNILASALGMDKSMFRRLLQSEGITIPKHAIYRKGDSINDIFRILKNPPYFVKPNDQGSSVGASIAKSKRSLKVSISLALKYSDVVLVDEYIRGVEVTSAIIGNDKAIALPLVEIIPKKAEFFDYNCKYTESGSEEIVPARVSGKITKKVQKIALKVYKILGCKGFARVDFILKGATEPYVLEINTIPGLTPLSLLPKAAKAVGISYKELIEKIIDYAIE